MTEFNREMAIKLMLDGQPAKLAVAVAHGLLLHEDVNLTWLVKPTGPLAATPSPDCVAKWLGQRPSPPARADIEWALDKCSG